MTNIFGELAPKYWEQGLPVIPLNKFDAVSKDGRKMGKAPFLTAWQQYAEKMPTPAQQADWVKRYPTNNIGLPLGPQSGLVAVDLDTDNPDVRKVLEELCPDTPWLRVGAKGYVAMFSYTGEKSFKIHTPNDGVILEVFSTSGQVVLPDSIHPDTLQPYTSNCNLWEVLDYIQPLPKGFEDKLRGQLSTIIEITDKADKQKFNTTEFISQGARDIAMTRYAGLLASGIMRGEMSVKRAMGNMAAWCETMVQRKSDGDNLSKAKCIESVLKFIRQDVSKGKVLPVGWDDDLSPQEKQDYRLDFSEEVEEWKKSRFMEYMADTLATTSDPHSDAVGNAINFVIDKMAVSRNLRLNEEEEILEMLREMSGSKTTKATYKKMIRELRSGEILGESHTEIAQEVIKVYEERRGQLASQDGSFYTWCGTHWEETLDGDIMQIIALNFGHLALGKRAADHAGILKTMKVILQEYKNDDIDNIGVNFQNGYLTKDLKLVKHSPEQGMNYVMGYSYHPEKAGKCPKFFTYLHESWGHHPDFEDKVKCLQEAMAATMFGAATTYQKAFLLQGTGGSGKSVLLEIINTLVPEEAKCAIPPDEWGQRFIAIEFKNKLLNVAGELKDKYNMRIEGAMFKTMIGGETISDRALFEGLQSFRPKCAHWFAGNHLPYSQDTSWGFFRRWIILNFDKVVPKDKIIRDFGKKIVYEEVEEIVAWAAQSFPDLEKRGYITEPQSSEDMVEHMAISNCHIRQFVKQCIIFDEKGEATERDLMKALFPFYSSTLNKLGSIPNPTDFQSKLDDILIEKGYIDFKHYENGIAVYKGIKVRKTQ